MPRYLSATEAAALPDDMLMSVESITRDVPPPIKPLPRWLTRVLPKSGLAGHRGTAEDDMLLDDEDEDDDDEDYIDEEPATLHEISFQLRRGEGMGIVGEDRIAIGTIIRILIGGLPPTTGRVVVRGRVAPLSNRELRRLIGTGQARKSVNVIARYFHWPRSLIDSRWDEIVEFAAAHEVTNPRFQTLRLAISAALHMDATVYVLDPSLSDDSDFGVRCLELVERRKAEGAAVIQAGRKMVEGVARLSDEVIWIEGGQPLYRGLPVEVAAEVHRNKVEKVAAHIVPVTAKLFDAGPVQLQDGVRHVDFEVHVLRKDLELGFGLMVTDAHGKSVELRKPELLEAPEPGVYRLGVSVPPNLLDEGAYRATLTVEIAVVGHEAAPRRDLLAFDLEVLARGGYEDDDIPVGFVLLPVAEVELDESDAPTWDVSRIGS